jgi:hypothetical protein
MCGSYKEQYAINKYSHASKAVELAGITPVFVFQSTNEVILRTKREFPWTRVMTFIADPNKTLYKGTGTESSIWKSLVSITHVFSKDFVKVGYSPPSYNSINSW